MATLQDATASVLSQALTAREALSGVFGSISLATWIFLLVPQLILNYKAKSAEGISLAFLTVWLVGDITNLAGALWAQLVPTVIALAIYFCFADFVLISQCLYYNTLNARLARRSGSLASASTAAGGDSPILAEDSPLLSRARSNSSLGLPGSQQRRRSSAATAAATSSLSKVDETERGSYASSATAAAWMHNTVSILLVCAAGAAGWAVAWQSGVWKPTPTVAGSGSETLVMLLRETPLGAEILGYFSAVCYLGARIPQIIKNYRDKSCDGLALLFFLLSLMGNATYGAGILFHSLERDYVLTNLPWLIGSLGTMVEDAIIFAQFRMYRDNGSDAIDAGEC